MPSSIFHNQWQWYTFWWIVKVMPGKQSNKRSPRAMNASTPQKHTRYYFLCRRSVDRYYIQYKLRIMHYIMFNFKFTFKQEIAFGLLTKTNWHFKSMSTTHIRILNLTHFCSNARKSVIRLIFIFKWELCARKHSVRSDNENKGWYTLYIWQSS